MKNYTVIGSKSRYFSLMEGQTKCGTLEYKKWFSQKAMITLSDQTNFKVEPQGFWGTSMEIKQYDQVLIDWKMNWKGENRLHARFNHTDSYYVLKRKGMFKLQYIFFDDSNQELMQLKPIFKWNSVHYNYEISTTDSFEALDNKLLLVLTAVHACNYHIAQMHAAAV